MLFLSVRGFLDYAGPDNHSRITRLPCCLPPTRNGVGILIYGLFAAQSPRPPMPLSTLQETPHDVPCKTRGQDGFATSFPVGLLHPLQHAGLARRTPACPSSVILAIGGVFTRVLVKHSKSFSFIDRISVGVDRMQQSFESFWKPGSRSRSRLGAASTDFTNSGYAMKRNSGPATLPPAG